MNLQRRLKILDGGGGAGPDLSIKVAFATASLTEVDQHFGAAETFAIYHVGADSWRLFEVIQFGSQAMDGDENKLTARIDALKGCAAVYSNAVGASAIVQLKQVGVQPLKVGAGSRVGDLIVDLQNELAAGPNAWLASAIERANPNRANRFERMEAEGWDE